MSRRPLTEIPAPPGQRGALLSASGLPGHRIMRWAVEAGALELTRPRDLRSGRYVFGGKGSGVCEGSNAANGVA